MKKFVTIFEKCENIHLIKDVGQIPYLMFKNYNFDASIVCVKNSLDYPYLQKEVKGLKLHFISKIKIGRISLAVVWYLLLNAKKIDVLHLFHHREPTYIYAIIYKKLNPNGHLYIKSDKGYGDIIKNRGLFPCIKKRHQKREKLFFRAVKYIDTISVENEKSCDFLQKRYEQYREKFIYITNGLDLDSFYREVPTVDYKRKENIILTVGRIGAAEKNNQMLLNAIRSVDLMDWKLLFIGPIEKNFEKNIEEFYQHNPNLRSSVLFLGALYEREALLKHYADAKLFCLTSLEESFGFVFIEAMSYGNYIITTDVSSARDITSDEKYGTIIYSEAELAEAISGVIQNNKNYENLSTEILSYAQNKYNWSSILSPLAQRFCKV